MDGGRWTLYGPGTEHVLILVVFIWRTLGLRWTRMTKSADGIREYELEGHAFHLCQIN